MPSTIMAAMSATPQPTAPAIQRASSADTVLSVITVDDSSHAQSSSSTPPTSIGDSASVSSASLKLDNAISTPATDPNSRSRRQRTSVGTYNVKVLAGTAIHAPKKFSKDPAVIEALARRRTISGDTLLGGLASANASTVTVEKDAKRLVSEGIEALDLQWSVKALPKSKSQIGLSGSPKKSAKQVELERKRATRSTGEVVESLTKKLSVLGKRSRKTFDDSVAGLAKAKRELRNLADTPEFAKIDTAPVVHEVWSNGKLVTPDSLRKKKKAQEILATKPKEDAAKPAEKPKPSGKKQKLWLSKGLYAGQQQDISTFDWFKESSIKMREDMEDVAPFRPNSFMPLPMWHGQRLLQMGRDFKLPFDICSPLPPGQPKPDEWRKTSSSKLYLRWKPET